MSHIPSFLLQHRVTVEPYLGNTADGPSFGPPVIVRCYAEESNQLERDNDGHDVLSRSRYFTRTDAPDTPPGSRVTLPSGRTYSVISVARHDGGDLPTPNHIEVGLAVMQR